MTLYDIALQVTDEALGKGTYAKINKSNPDPQVQAAILRSEKTECVHGGEIDNKTLNGRTVLRANPGKYRVIGVDTFEAPAGADWVYAEWNTLGEAVFCAGFHGKSMNVTHVYDDQGHHLYQAGTV